MHAINIGLWRHVSSFSMLIIASVCHYFEHCSSFFFFFVFFCRHAFNRLNYLAISQRYLNVYIQKWPSPNAIFIDLLKYCNGLHYVNIIELKSKNFTSFSFSVFHFIRIRLEFLMAGAFIWLFYSFNPMIMICVD